MEMLVVSGILQVEKRLTCMSPDVFAIVNENASITVFDDKIEKTFEHLSGAAKFIENKSLNGWLYWYVDIGDERLPLDILRDKYLQET